MARQPLVVNPRRIQYMESRWYCLGGRVPARQGCSICIYLIANILCINVSICHSVFSKYFAMTSQPSVAGPPPLLIVYSRWVDLRNCSRVWEEFAYLRTVPRKPACNYYCYSMRKIRKKKNTIFSISIDFIPSCEKENKKEQQNIPGFFISQIFVIIYFY